MASLIPRAFRVRRWRMIVSEAETLVDHNKKTGFNLKSVFGSNLKISRDVMDNVGENHPTVQITRRFDQDLKVKGLLTLLLAKAAGHVTSVTNDDKTFQHCGITEKQRHLADVLQLFYTGALLKKGIPLMSTVEGRRNIDESLIVAYANMGLAAINDSQVQELILQGLNDMSKSEQFGEVDKNGNALPDQLAPQAIWEKKIFLQEASLTSLGCQAMMVLGGHSQKMQEKARLFGVYSVLALKVKRDIQSFAKIVKRHQESIAPFSLELAPVIIHLQSDPALLHYIRQRGKNDANELNFQKIYRTVEINGGLKKSCTLLENYLSKAIAVLKILKKSNATEILQEMLAGLKDKKWPLSE